MRPALGLDDAQRERNLDPDLAFVDHRVRLRGLGCNRCACTDGFWGCTEINCPEAGAAEDAGTD